VCIENTGLNEKQTRMTKDIRDKSYISHEDIIELNFIRKPGIYVFRKYHKQGLRSQIMEVLDPDDVIKQNKGETIKGILFFPWAKPLKMLRIFRTKFDSINDVFEETRKLKIIEKYLPPDSYAKSDEFIVDYIKNGKRDFILCGLQEYVEGEALNPWDLINKNILADLFTNMKAKKQNALEMNTSQLIKRFKRKAENFIESVKKMILEVNYVPDLAGVENLLITRMGNIKLVDINNISKVSFSPRISLDDKGYPVCDKSVEAISILEQKLMDKPIDKTEKIYRTFLAPQRIKEVKYLEEKFHRSLKLMNS